MSRELRTIHDQINVLGIAEGFFQSSVLFALLKLRVFDLIGDGDKPLDELAAGVGAQPKTLARLLNAGVMLKLLQTTDGCRYQLTPVSRSVLLTSRAGGDLASWIANLAYFEQALIKLDEAVLTSGPTVDPSSHFGEGEQTREFTLAMHDYAALRGKELAHYLDTAGCEKLLDIGCGHGGYSFHLGMANPRLQLYLLDSPGVLEITREVQARYRLTNDVHYIPSDAMRDEIPGEYDMILISNTLHALGPEASLALIRRLYRSVKPGGSLVIQAQFLRDDRMGGRWPVLMDLIQLCITTAGANHSVAETKAWLEEAGFSRMEFQQMSLFNTNSFLRGYKA